MIAEIAFVAVVAAASFLIGKYHSVAAAKAAVKAEAVKIETELVVKGKGISEDAISILNRIKAIL